MFLHVSFLQSATFRFAGFIHYFSGNTPVDVVFFPAEMTVIIACMCCSAVHLQGCCDTVAQFVFFECEESPFGISGIVGQDIDKAGETTLPLTLIT